MNGRTNDKPKAICHSTFLKLGHKARIADFSTGEYFSWAGGGGYFTVSSLHVEYFILKRIIVIFFLEE